MIALPPCDSLFIDVELRLAHVAPSSPAQRCTENQLVLQVLAADAPAKDDNAQLARIEAKQDLLLYLLLKQNLPSTTNACLCRCSLDDIFILENKNAPQAAPKMANMQLVLQEPLSLRLQVQCREENDAQILWQAQIQDHANEACQDAWAKWLFQQHRHAIQQKTQPSPASGGQY